MFPAPTRPAVAPAPDLCPFPTVLSRLNSTSLMALGYTGAFVYPYPPSLCRVGLKRSPGCILFFQAGLYWGLYPGSIPGSGRSPGGGNGNPLHCSCLENPMDRGAWWATVRGVPKSLTRLSDEHFHFCFLVTAREVENRANAAALALWRVVGAEWR